jgi:hypothetical protein
MESGCAMPHAWSTRPHDLLRRQEGKKMERPINIFLLNQYWPHSWRVLLQESMVCERAGLASCFYVETPVNQEDAAHLDHLEECLINIYSKEMGFFFCFFKKKRSSGTDNIRLTSWMRYLYISSKSLQQDTMCVHRLFTFIMWSEDYVNSGFQAARSPYYEIGSRVTTKWSLMEIYCKERLPFYCL